MKLKLALNMVLASLPSAACYAVEGVGVDVKALFAVGTCTGDNANCPVTATMNAIGDPFNVNPETVAVIDLGILKQEKSVNLTLPQHADEFSVLSFRPTEGDLQGKEVFFALKRHAQGAPGTQFEGIEIIEIYRQDIANPQAIWLRAGRFQSDEGYPKTFNFTFMPNGNAQVTDPDSDTMVKLDLGVKDLASA